MIGQGYGGMSRREIREMGILCYQLGVKDAEDLQSLVRSGILAQAYAPVALDHLNFGEVQQAKKIIRNLFR